MIAVNKQQLKTLQEKREHVNTDNGQVFTNVSGRLHDDGLWHLIVHERPLAEYEVLPSFSLESVLETDTMSSVDEVEPVKTIPKETHDNTIAESEE